MYCCLINRLNDYRIYAHKVEEYSLRKSRYFLNVVNEWTFEL